MENLIISSVSGNAIEGVTAYTAAKSAGERRERERESE